MSQTTLSKIELLKLDSRQLRGTLAEELQNDRPDFSADAIQMLKYHGSYQQDDRDVRKQKNADGTKKEKAYSCLIRTAVPGGKVTAEQFLAELDLCDRLGNGTLRITTRQGFQLHGVLKSNLKETIRTINQIKLSTYAACGDVSRNVMCCPAPFKNNPVREQMQAVAHEISVHFRPKSSSYYELWLTDEDGNKENHAEFLPVEEPIYGERYLPRKFKFGVAEPTDNCIDVYTQDVGLLAIVEGDQVVGYNVIVGGGMGNTPSAEKTFPRLGDELTFATPDNVIAVCEAIVKVQRDFGNREDRKRARLKYLLHDWGVAAFKAKVEEYYGASLPEPRYAPVTGIDDHLGWHVQGDGKLFYGINIENGRIADVGDVRIKSGLRAIFEQYGMESRLTPLQSVILCDVDPKDRRGIETLLHEYGMKTVDELSLARRFAVACPALPTCGLAITESERVMPQLIDLLEPVLAAHGLEQTQISIRMTGCPNGCARPYVADVGLVGKSVGKYTIYLGGNPQGTRIGFVYQDAIPLEEIPAQLSPLLASYVTEKVNDEGFGDYCARLGRETLLAKVGRSEAITLQN
ncbi:NADPH-dependent assimilatory sulfite reductase hemoprotein subunit [Blastopirellula sp. JC732]|uniref:NADPH-dependent assimilatory sulfite reductase hemoprotein subunit n=1 Tax=Blastopirellula sediminis TaxID=2894196 RepID=A0A9X1MQV0_9BACT|nr:NADPH-dependent assimilatory sulfite reductase hemoprotein subunit [Blastopirellula sediminis]MCC9605641.1 NADPH-dependent assimilatory sulfite reductase hemoprotein subunit [Blastopirellula sediminis]MCC9631059.1 NADPH-dependent assimilatory sulfite reductase hemoprotein subunit [Blastopirellula sediminis]